MAWLFLMACFVIAGIAHAQTIGSQPISLSNPIPACTDLICVANSIIQFLLKIAIPICSIMVLVGGFQMMTAGGDPTKFANGRKTILYAALGFAVVLIATGVGALVSNFITGQ